MEISFKNIKGENYFIKTKLTKKGNKSYYMTRKGDSECLKEIPEGYEVFEKYDSGMMFIRKRKKEEYTMNEIEIIETELKANKSVYKYKLDISGKLIKIYTVERNMNTENDSMSRMFGPETILSFKRFEERMRINRNKNEFELSRYCYRGRIDDWIIIDYDEDLKEIVKNNIKHLGKESYYNLM